MSLPNCSVPTASATAIASFPAVSRVFHPPPRPTAHLPLLGQMTMHWQFCSPPAAFKASATSGYLSHSGSWLNVTSLMSPTNSERMWCALLKVAWKVLSWEIAGPSADKPSCTNAESPGSVTQVIAGAAPPPGPNGSSPALSCCAGSSGL